jgi:hypothetical protein
VANGLIKPFVEMVETFGICILDEEAYCSPARYVAKMTPGHDHHFGISAAEVCSKVLNLLWFMFEKVFSHALSYDTGLTCRPFVCVCSGMKTTTHTHSSSWRCPITVQECNRSMYSQALLRFTG